MCEYCENIKEVDGKEDLDYCLSEGIVYEKQSGKHWIITKDWHYDYNDCLDIEFCPMCGRKLSEVLNMQNNETYIKVLQFKLENLRMRCHESARYAFDNGNYGVLYIVTADELKTSNISTDSETDRLVQLPFDAMETANMLINATYRSKVKGMDRFLCRDGYMLETDMYSIDDLEHIAEHLLVYCKHNREDEE